MPGLRLSGMFTIIRFSSMSIQYSVHNPFCFWKLSRGLRPVSPLLCSRQWDFWLPIWIYCEGKQKTWTGKLCQGLGDGV